VKYYKASVNLNLNWFSLRANPADPSNPLIDLYKQQNLFSDLPGAHWERNLKFGNLELGYSLTLNDYQNSFQNETTLCKT
jgi:hypothetical protein